MTRRLPPLGALRAFEAAARLGSFKLAAAELAVTPTAISHRIRALEAGMGVVLFTRQTRKVVLTEEGRGLFGPLRDALDQMAEAVATVKRPARQVATLSATVAFTGRLLVPCSAAFRTWNPGWDLRLHASDDPVDLLAGEADAAIRYGQGHYPGLTTVPLLGDSFAPVCSPHLGIEKPEDLAKAPLIHFEWGPAASMDLLPTWSSWVARARTVHPGLRHFTAEGGLTFGDESSALLAVVAGQGVALMSRTLVAAELASRALVQPFGPVLDGLRYDLVFPAGATLRQAVSVLRNWVTTEVAARAGAKISLPITPARSR